jgi:hypothetical protein
MTTAREIVGEEWAKAVDEFELRPGSVTEKVVSRIMRRIDEATDPHQIYRIESDGFKGTQIGTYKTRENRQGVVLQQLGSKVVHVYPEHRLIKDGVAR